MLRIYTVWCVMLGAILWLCAWDSAQAQILPAGLSQQEWLSVQRQIIRQQSLNQLESVDQRQNERRPARERTVDDPNAVFSQTDYIKPSHVGEGDLFAFSVAMSGDTLVVGVPFEDSSSTGSAGNPANNSAGNAGAAYVFERVAGVWQQQAYLKASNAGAGDEFGIAVDISGNTIIVGARREDTSRAGINPVSDNNRPDSGAAYIFVRNNGLWSQQAFLKPHATYPYDLFGHAVAINGSTAIVGAPFENSSTDGVNPAVNISADNAGAAYVFTRSGSTWSQQAYLKASNSDAHDQFGISVDIHGNTVVVGAFFEDSNSNVINGGQGNASSGTDFGAAYVFSRLNGVWSQRAYLKAPNPGSADRFGVSTRVFGDVIVVGAYLEDSVATGVNGNRDDNTVADSGAAYVYRRNQNGGWYFSQYLKASNTGTSDQFGYVVDINDAYIAVGALAEDSSIGGVDRPSDNFAGDAGAAYLFKLDADGSITPLSYLKSRYPQGGDQLGYNLALSGNTLATGARLEDSAATGVNGNEQDNAVPDAGAAFIFAPTSSFHALGGQLAGLLQNNRLTLSNNGMEEVTISADGLFRFPGFYLSGTSYNIEVAEQPDTPLQDCVVNNGMGTINGAGVDEILVDCQLRNLFIPSLINAIDTGLVEVPVNFAPEGDSFGGVSFSLDYDEACLNPDRDGDGQLDDVRLALGSDFAEIISFDPSDSDGEIDISIYDPAPPFAALPHGELLRIVFLSECAAAQQEIPYETVLDFSTEPAPSFTNTAASNASGSWAAGSVRVWSGGGGDCNVDGIVANSDLLGLGVEIFDGDGDVAIEAPAQGYLGSPLGCDSNQDQIITVADVSCINQLIFGDSCSNIRSTSLVRPEFNIQLSQAPERLWLETDLQSQGQDISGLSYVLVLDPLIFDLSLFDQNYNAVPDLIEYPQGQPETHSISWYQQDGRAYLNVLLNAKAGHVFADGLQLRIGIPTAQPANAGLFLHPNMQPRFASPEGADVPGFGFVADEILRDSF